MEIFPLNLLPILLKLYQKIFEERKITLLRKFEYCLHYPIIIIVKKEWKNRFFFV